MAWTAPRTWVVNEVVTASLLNTHLRDNLKAIGDAWTPYTPSWTAATTNPVLGNGTLNGFYVAAGKLTVVRIELTTGGTTTYGSGAYRFSLPFTSVAVLSGAGASLGNAICFDTSAGTRAFRHIWHGATTYVQLKDDTGVDVTQAAPFTWASGDSCSLQFVYEAA